MLQSVADPALNLFEISGLAWAAAVDRAIQTLAAEPGVDLDAFQRSAGAQALDSLAPEETRRLDAELRAAGIAGPDGAIRDQWLLAVWISLSAPVRVSAVARAGDDSAHTDLGLAGGRGVAVSYRRRVGTTAAGIDAGGVRDVVEVALFDERDAWAAVRRILPDFAGLQAGSESARGVGGVRTPVSPQQLQALGRASLPQDVKDAIQAPRCTVHLEVAAVRPGTVLSGTADSGPAAPFRAADVWSLADKLYAVRTSGDDGGRSLVLEDVPPGDVARELGWRLLGAREFLAAAEGHVA